jgi:hypothetical protein
MDYFIMSQDKRVGNVAKLTSGIPGVQHLNRQHKGAIPITRLLYVEEGQHNEYPDYIEELGLISEKLKGIMSIYQQDITFKTVVLIEMNHDRYETYYLVAAPEIQRSPATKDSQRGKNRLVLDQKSIGGARVFCTKYYGNQLIVRLDVAESMLRREAYGVWFKKVRIDTEWEDN